MNMRRTFAAAGVLALLLCGLAQGKLVTRTVEYQLPTGETARGYLAYTEDAQAGRPGMLIIPEWWGLNAYAKWRARQMADLGYVAFVADMYGDGQTTDDPAKAKELSSAAYQAGLAKLAEPALQQLRQNPLVSDAPIAAMGFCFGGSTVTAMATAAEPMDLAAAVSFHGGLGPDAAPEPGTREFTTPLLVLHGGADPLVKADAFAGFVQGAIEAGVPMTVVNFPGVVHAFSNPVADKAGIDGVAYDQQAARLSFQIMLSFLGQVLAPLDDNVLDSGRIVTRLADAVGAEPDFAPEPGELPAER